MIKDAKSDLCIQGKGDVTTKMDHLYGYQLMSKIKAFVSPFYDWHGLSGFSFPQYFFSQVCLDTTSLIHFKENELKVPVNMPLLYPTLAAKLEREKNYKSTLFSMCLSHDVLRQCHRTFFVWVKLNLFPNHSNAISFAIFISSPSNCSKVLMKNQLRY